MEIIISSFLGNKSERQVRHRNRDQIMPMQLSIIKGLFVSLSFSDRNMRRGRDQEQIARMLSPVKLFQEILSLWRADNTVQIIQRY